MKLVYLFLTVPLALSACKSARKNDAAENKSLVDNFPQTFYVNWSAKVYPKSYCWWSLKIKKDDLIFMQREAARGHDPKSNFAVKIQKYMLENSTVISKNAVTLEGLANKISQRDKDWAAFIGGGDAVSGGVGMILWPILRPFTKNTRSGEETISIVKADAADSAKVKNGAGGPLLLEALEALGNETTQKCVDIQTLRQAPVWPSIAKTLDNLTDYLYEADVG